MPSDNQDFFSDLCQLTLESAVEFIKKDSFKNDYTQRLQNFLSDYQSASSPLQQHQLWKEAREVLSDMMHEYSCVEGIEEVEACYTLADANDPDSKPSSKSDPAQTPLSEDKIEALFSNFDQAWIQMFLAYNKMEQDPQAMSSEAVVQVVQKLGSMSKHSEVAIRQDLYTMFRTVQNSDMPDYQKDIQLQKITEDFGKLQEQFRLSIAGAITTLLNNQLNIPDEVRNRYADELRGIYRRMPPPDFRSQDGGIGGR
jgi:hypothetical protein